MNAVRYSLGSWRQPSTRSTLLILPKYTVHSVHRTNCSRPFSIMVAKASLKRAEDFVDFLNASPSGMTSEAHLRSSHCTNVGMTAFHAVQSSKQRLEAAGFTQIRVGVSCSKRQRYFLTISHRSAIRGPHLSSPVASTTSPAMPAPSSPSQSAPRGSQGTQYRWSARTPTHLV